MTKTLRGLDPRQPFYLTMCVGNSDGSLNPGDLAEHVGTDLGDAVAAATESVDAHEGDVYVYECRPVRRAYRYTVPVDDRTVS